MATSDERPLSLELERYLKGELAPDRVDALRARLGDEALAALRERDAREAAALFEALPPAHLRARLEARAAPPRPARPVVWAAPVLAAALALFAWLGRDARAPDELDTTRPKGLRPALVLYRKGARGVEELPPDARVQPGDLLQIAYVAAGFRYGAILSLDGAGAVTVHASGAALEPTGKHLLDRAYVLDAAPRFERFVFVASARPFDVEPIKAQLRELARGADPVHTPLTLAPGVEQSSFVVTKGGP